MKSKIEVLPGEFIKYEISNELLEQLAKIGIDAQEEIELACKDFGRELKPKKLDQDHLTEWPGNLEVRLRRKENE